jgi:hypothetical protein
MQEFSGCRTLEFEFMLREAHPTESHEEKNRLMKYNGEKTD